MTSRIPTILSEQPPPATFLRVGPYNDEQNTGSFIAFDLVFPCSVPMALFMEKKIRFFDYFVDNNVNLLNILVQLLCLLSVVFCL